MTINQRTLAEIREVNLSYLILAQSMLRDDRVQAMFQLGHRRPGRGYHRRADSGTDGEDRLG